jgi:hypothetical protein
VAPPYEAFDNPVGGRGWRSWPTRWMIPPAVCGFSDVSTTCCTRGSGRAAAVWHARIERHRPHTLSRKILRRHRRARDPRKVGEIDVP